MLQANTGTPCYSAPRSAVAGRQGVIRARQGRVRGRNGQTQALPHYFRGSEENEEPRVTAFFTPEGIVHIRDPVPPRSPIFPPDAVQGLPLQDEQKLVVGASFLITGRNAVDPRRRISVSGFCQSVDVLFSSIEYTVHANRGEILEERRLLKSGIHEVLKLTVAIPYLWGVPPQLDMLNVAVH